MSIKNRIAKLESALGVNIINVGNELERLKALALSGKAPPPKTIADYERMISECDNPELIKLYQATIRAESQTAKPYREILLT